jgi:hypothetical protein
MATGHASLHNRCMPHEPSRIEATATVRSARQIGMMINSNQGVQLELLIPLEGTAIPVTALLPVPYAYLARLQPGAQLAVTIDPAQPESVLIDWTR